MSSGQELWLLVALFYLSECCYWVPRGALVWRLGRRWRVAGGEIGNEKGRLVLWNPLGEAGGGAVFEPWPFSVSESGVSGVRVEMPNPGRGVDPTGLKRDWADTGKIWSNGNQVVVDGRLLARAASARAARAHADFLGVLMAAPRDGRGRLIREELERAMDAGKIRERWEAFSGDGKWAKTWCSVVGWAMLVWVPVVYWVYGDGLVVIAAAGLMWLAVVTSAVLCFRLQRRWFPEERGGRWQHLLVSLFAPPYAARGVDRVARNVMAGFHPMGAVEGVGEEARFGAALRDLWYPVVVQDDEIGGAFRERFLQPVFEEACRARGFDPGELLREPAAREERSEWYCPRCHGCYVDAVGSCVDCAGVGLKRFS